MKTTSIWKLTLTAALALTLLPASAFAQAKSHGKGKGHAKHHDRDADRDRGEDRDGDQDRDNDHDRDNVRDRDNDRDRDRNDIRDRDRDRDHDRDRVLGSSATSSRPPGWSKGKKTGWGNCDVPPGQVKKYGCHPNRTLADHARRDRDRDRRAGIRTWPTGSTSSVIPPTTTTRARRTARDVRDRVERDAERARDSVTPR